MIGDKPTHWLPIVMNAWDCEALDGTPVKVVDPVKQAIRIPRCDHCQHWRFVCSDALDRAGVSVGDCDKQADQSEWYEDEYCSRFERKP